MVEAMAKNTPCASPVMKRAASKLLYPGATAAKALPAMNSASSASSSDLRGRRAVSAVSTGAPMVTPRA